MITSNIQKVIESYLPIINKLLHLTIQQEITIEFFSKPSSFMPLLKIKIGTYQYPQSFQPKSLQELSSVLIKAISSIGYSFTQSLNNDFRDNDCLINNFHELIILYLIIALDSNHQSLIDIILKHFELNEQIKIIKIIKNYIDISLTPKLESINGLQKLHITIAMIENKAKGKEQTMTAKIAKLEKEIEEMKQGENVILNMNIYNSASSIASSSEKDKEKEKESDKKKIESNSLHAVSYSQLRTCNPNENNKLTNETFSIEEYKTPSKFSKVKLTDQDYLKIILKKDYIISQLRSLLEERELASKIKDDSDKREEIASLYKKELDEFKARYEVEFELMASAMYNLGLNYLSYREKNLLQYHTNWLSKQKQQYYYNKEDKTEY